MVDLIQSEIFYSLTEIKKLEIDSNIHGLKNGFNFLSSLNSNLTIKLNDSKDYTINLKINKYNYLDKDFCLFEKFPKNKFILIYNTDRNFLGFFKCSCLMVWLLKLYNFEKGDQLVNETCFNFGHLSCDFVFLTKLCDKKNYSKKKFNFDDMDFLFVSETANYFVVILIPILCFFSFLSNIINMFILKKFCLKAKNLIIEVEKMHRLMFFTSMINSTYSFIYFFHLFNICIFENLSLCPIISRSFGVQFFEIYFIDFFASILKTISNFLAVLVSLQRLTLLKNKTLSKFNFIDKILIFFL